jgi:hypothetical protein
VVGTQALPRLSHFKPTGWMGGDCETAPPRTRTHTRPPPARRLTTVPPRRGGKCGVKNPPDGAPTQTVGLASAPTLVWSAAGERLLTRQLVRS